MAIAKQCFKCAALFECSRSSTALCAYCQQDLRNVRRNAWRQQRAMEVQNLLNNVLPNLPAELHQRARKLAPQVLNGRNEIDTASEAELKDNGGTFVRDLQPAGTKSAYGADEGRSTYDKDLAGKLDNLSEDAANHEWWAANAPADVFFLFDEPETFGQFMSRDISDRPFSGLDLETLNY